MAMVSFAHLSPEERIGLGIAATAHVALVAALVWQVRDDPRRLPFPERMEVSLATDVSLTSTAPDPSAEPQAAIAPELSPEPAPVVEPEPVREMVRPAPVPRPTVAPAPSPAPRQTAAPTPTPAPRQAAAPTPAPTPRATPARAGGSRIGADFLPGTGGSERSDARGTPAATFGPAEAASLNQAIARQLRPHWNAPQGVDAEQLVTVVRFRLNPNGSLSGSPTCLRQSGETASNAPQKDLHCERALRAVRLAAPFDLPEQFYDRWRLIDSTFDRRL
jgi:periplasmic protein TonB